jgi:hypothetical protein
MVGITKRGIDDIGSVIKYSLLSTPPPIQIQSQDTVISFNWEGYQRTEADELYHAVWETAEGTYELRSPLSGTISKYNEPELECPSEDDWLFEITIDENRKEDFNNFVNEEQYDRMIHEQERNHQTGLFKEQEMKL